MTTPSGGSTTIGTAVLQIIPSLRGVTDEIEKQIQGKAVEVTIEPTVDKAATQQAGKDAGDTIVKEAKEAVRKGDIGKTIGDEVKSSTTRSGGLRDAAIGAATEFGRGFIEGVTSELRTGNANISGALSGINAQVRNTSNLIQGIGGVTGIDVTPIVSATDTISGAVQHVGDTASNTRSQVDGVIGPLQTFAGLAGEDSKLFKAVGKLPLIGQFAELIPVLRDGNAQLESIVQKYTGLNVPLSGESWVRWLTDNGRAFNSASDNAQRALDEARRKAEAAGPPPGGRGVVSGSRATGGMIPGFSTKDDRLGLVNGRGLIGLAGGEGIINATSTRRLGGAPFINWLNGFADGGVVPPDVAAAQDLVGTPYSQAKRNDCSGTVAQVINRTLGTGGGLMSTKTAAEWLKARGFVPGIGGPGQISVGWYDHGPNPNDGHMAMTLSDGRNAESGGSSGPFTIGGKAAGASSPQFDQHMHLPTVYGEGPAGPSSAAPAASSSGASTGGGVSAPPPSSGGGSAAGSGGSGSGSGSMSFSLPSSLSGFGSSIGEQIGKQLSGAGDLSGIGAAAGSFVDGQIGSALDVFGIPSSPGWLKGISTFVGGLSIGGGGGGFGEAAPGSAAPIPHMGSGAAPGPGGPGSRQQNQNGVTYNITARDTEDAFVKAQRVEREKAAAKLSRF